MKTLKLAKKDIKSPLIEKSIAKTLAVLFNATQEEVLEVKIGKTRNYIDYKGYEISFKAYFMKIENEKGEVEVLDLIYQGEKDLKAALGL